MEQPRLDVADRLRAALETGALTDAQADRGENLLSRLKSPVRIAILGPRRSGKSSLLNVLAGAAVLPEGKPLPTLQLTWGEKSETTCIYGDGTRRAFAEAKPHDLVSMSPIFIEMRRRLPALRTVALLEVVMDGTAKQKARALAWAAQRCDLAIWCTATFDDEEQVLWQGMPPGLQSHATLVLTRADKFESTEAIANRLAILGAAAAGRFRDVRPIAALQAMTAFHADGSADVPILQRSGAQALIGSLLAEVEKGRAAVRAAADALLNEGSTVQEAVILPEAQDIGPEETKAPAPAPLEAAPPQEFAAPSTPVAAPAPAATAPVATDPAETAPGETTSGTQPEPAHGAEPAPAPAPPAPRGPVLSEEGREALESVVSYLSGRAGEMIEMLDGDADAATEEVMPALLDDAMWLSDFLAAPFHHDDQIVAQTRNVVYDITDLIQLMEMERNIGAATDATCLMLQAKRDIQSLLAA